MNLIHFHYFNHTAITCGYEVRVVNSWTAYDWLTPATIANITKAIQNTKIDETVTSLLKLALLMEHGGVFMGNLQLLFARNDFEWVERMFYKGGEAIGYRLPPDEAQVYLPLISPAWPDNYYFS
jgi:hypothetical protein